MAVSVSNSPAWGDMVVGLNPIVQFIERMACWRAYQVRWFRQEDRSLKVEELGPLEGWKLRALRIIQVVLFPLTLLCMLLKTFLRFKEPIHNQNGKEIVMPTKEFLADSSLLPHEAILIIGSTGAGKSRVITHIKRSLPDDYILLDPDQLMGNAPEYTYQQQRGLDQAADNNHKTGSKLRDLQFGRVMKLKHNMLLETTSNLEVLRKWVLPPLKAAGYRIRLIYVDTQLDICIERANRRSRKVPRDFIIGAHQASQESFKALKSEVDEWEHYNNDSENDNQPPHLVNSGNN